MVKTSLHIQMNYSKNFKTNISGICRFEVVTYMRQMDLLVSLIQQIKMSGVWILRKKIQRRVRITDPYIYYRRLNKLIYVKVDSWCSRNVQLITYLKL